jgi:hypothetical protein
MDFFEACITTNVKYLIFALSIVYLNERDVKLHWYPNDTYCPLTPIWVDYLLFCSRKETTRECRPYSNQLP